MSFSSRSANSWFPISRMIWIEICKPCSQDQIFSALEENSSNFRDLSLRKTPTFLRNSTSRFLMVTSSTINFNRKSGGRDELSTGAANQSTEKKHFRETEFFPGGQPRTLADRIGPPET